MKYTSAKKWTEHQRANNWRERQATSWSGKASAVSWPLAKDWPVSRFLPISRFQPGRFLPKLTLNDTEIMRGSHFPTRSPLLGHTEWRLGWTAVITQLTNWTRLYQPQQVLQFWALWFCRFWALWLCRSTQQLKCVGYEQINRLVVIKMQLGGILVVR